ncbi:MAG TPA: chloride channel protein [Kofleriaceae bacterium]|nr:chloride channel protein [Kofleriaceae bacterium]
MPDHDASSSSTTPGLPVAPSLGPTLEAARIPLETKLIDGRVVVLSGLAVLVGLALGALAVLCMWKLVSWSVALGSGTSGGTLAPLFTIGGGVGAALGAGAAAILPGAGVDLRIAALVGMAALFAGSSRAVLASIVFAFEITRQPIGLLPLLAGCTAAYLISCLVMRHSIMTEKIARRGVRVVGEYTADFLAQRQVGEVASRQVVSLATVDRVADVREWMTEVQGLVPHSGFPVLAEGDRLVGVVTRRDLFFGPGAGSIGELVKRPPVVTYPDTSLRDAADHMVREGVGRLVVVQRAEPTRVVGILTRSDLLSAHGRRLRETDMAETTLRPLGGIRPGRE